MKFQVKIDKAIQAGEKNLTVHKAELKEATEVWTEKAIKALTTLKDAVDRKGLEASYNEVQTLFYAKPKDNRNQYAKFLGALYVAKDSGETTIMMDEDDYDRLFNDNWDWAVSARTTNSAYKK